MAYSPYGSSFQPTSFFSSSAPLTEPAPVVEKVRRHPKYYLQGGDIHFLVENFLFRVHRYFFERESAYFREKLGIPASAGQSAKGSSDTNPFSLDDVRADDFSRFLWVFYNPKYSIYDATVEDWRAILKLAYDWRFAEIKKLSCRELEKFEIEPVLKISIYQTYDLDKKLLIPSYAALTVRPQPLSVKEGRQLGLETALLLATARECARGKFSESGKHSPTAASLDQDALVNVIRDVFGLTNGPPSPSLSPVDARGPGVIGIPTTPSKQATQSTSPPPAGGHSRTTSSIFNSISHLSGAPAQTGAGSTSIFGNISGNGAAQSTETKPPVVTPSATTITSATVNTATTGEATTGASGDSGTPGPAGENNAGANTDSSNTTNGAGSGNLKKDPKAPGGDEGGDTDVEGRTGGGGFNGRRNGGNNGGNKRGGRK